MVSLLTTERGAGDALVRVGRLLDDDLLGARLARAAACGEKPEQARGNGEGDAEPHGRQHLVAKRGLDVVRLQHSLEDASQDRVGCGSSGSRSNDEDGLSLVLLA
jgi:hypothetical protein